MIAALFIAKGGCYFGLPDVDPWDQERDARTYAGPWPVVAHPPCERWGRFWHGSTRKPHQFKLGDDAGCFESALASVRRWGGVLEHPADSRAWSHFKMHRRVMAAGLQPICGADGLVVSRKVGTATWPGNAHGSTHIRSANYQNYAGAIVSSASIPLRSPNTDTRRPGA